MTTLLNGNAKIKIRNARARAFLLRCRKADGCQIGLAHQGAAQGILWAWTDEDHTAPVLTAGLLVEPEVRTFSIPRQAADSVNGTAEFAGGISENDEIEWDGRTYVVHDPWSMRWFEAVYDVTATAKAVRRAGP